MAIIENLEAFHEELARRDLKEYKLDRHFLIKSTVDKKNPTSLKHEMAIEASMCEILSKEDRAPFGCWDYISHQVIASPFKPIDYMDKMDLFGYKYIQGYKIKSKYMVAEIKKDSATIDVIEQIMKYVDWISNEYAYKDYSMIEAYIIAKEFSKDVIDLAKQFCIRNYTKGFRPSKHHIWNNIKLVKYSVQNDDIYFSTVKID